MIKNISYVSLSFVYVNLLGYIFHFYVSRSLSPKGYGEFIVLYSLMMTIGNISTIFSTVSIKTIVENINFKFQVLRYFRILAIVIGIIITVLGFIVSPLIKSFLKISYLPYIWLVSISWFLMFCIAVERGFLQALNRFDITSFNGGFELTIRLLMAIILISLGFYIWGALFPSIFGQLSALIFLLIINKNFFGTIKKIPFKKIFNIALYASPSGFFVYMDDIFIKRIFDSHTAGLYASASILGKALIWFSITIFSVYFPKIVECKNLEKFKKLCLNIVLLIFSIYLISDVGIVIFGKKLFIMLFGVKFEKGFEILPYYIIAIFPLTISIIFIGINTAREKYLKLIYSHLIFYLLGFIFIKFNSITVYLWYLFLINLFFSLIYAWFTFFKENKY